MLSPLCTSSFVDGKKRDPDCTGQMIHKDRTYLTVIVSSYEYIPHTYIWEQQSKQYLNIFRCWINTIPFFHTLGNMKLFFAATEP